MFRAIAALLVCAGCQLGEQKSGDIIDKLLLYREYPRVQDLSTAQKAEAVSKLKALRPTITGKRLQKLSFVLAALGSDYVANRDYLVGVLRGCSSPHSECDEDTAGFLIGLYHAGHRDVLTPLLMAGLHSDGALSGMLGPFYGELLITAPSDFMASLRRLTGPSREAVCTLAGGGDGGGMEPSNFRQVQRALNRIGDGFALQCLRHLENSNQETAEINKESR